MTKIASMVGYALKKHVFNSVPQEVENDFREHVYKLNLFRFVTLLTVLIAFDATSMVFYWYHYRSVGEINTVHMALNGLAVVVEMAMVLYYSRSPQYNKKSFFARHADILVAAAVIGIELGLYLVGPRDIGALIRIMAAPFVMSSCVIISQPKATLLNTITFLIYTMPFVGVTGHPAFMWVGYIVNIWLIILPCVIVVSASVYSGFVQIYIDGIKEKVLIEGLEDLNSQLDLMARRDSLTGLANRRGFEFFIEDNWERELQRANSITIFSMDIDYFNVFSEHCSGTVVDNCLTTVAQALQSCVGPGISMLARKNGDRFILVMFGQEHAKMVKLAIKMRLAVEAGQIENPYSKDSLYITISCGMATVPITPEGFSEAEKIAEKCLLIAKAGGSNRVIQFDGRTGRYMDSEFNAVNTDTMSFEPMESMEFEQLNNSIKKLGLECSFMYSRDHQIIEFSKDAQELFEMPHKVSNPGIQKILEILPIIPADRGNLLTALQECISALKSSMELEVTMRFSNSERARVLIRMNCLYNERGNLSFAHGSMFKISNIFEISKHLDTIAMVNSITGLPNRKSFYQNMNDFMNAPFNEGHMVIMDIQDFKSINGMFGHNIGDSTIKKVGDILTRMTKQKAELYHYALDQFVLVFKGTNEKETIDFVERAEKFFLTAYAATAELTTSIRFNIGIIYYNDEMKHLDELMVNLDIALQKAKRNSNESFHLFNAADKDEYMQRINLEKNIFEAVQNNFRGFSLHYQPLYSTATNECVGAEALLRWSYAGKPVPPSVVIPILEHNGWIKQVGNWILETVCKQCAEWIDGGTQKNFYVHINLSVIQLDKQEFVDDILDMVQKYGLETHNIVLEITESVFVSERLFAMDVLNALRKRGIKISIDDFGTGYSSLSYLRRLPVDQIKIDRFFLNEIESDDAVHNILKSVAELISNMGFTSCIEGVETEGQLSIVKKFPVDIVQGYLLGRPQPAQDFNDNVLKKMAIARA